MICVIGGGEWQKPLIEAIQKKGYQVLCINLYSTTEGSKLADYCEIADIKDKQSCLKIVKRYNDKNNIIAVMSDQTDIAVNTVAYINESLGLYGISSDIADKFTDKYKMRQGADKVSVKNPLYKLVRNKKQICDFISKVNFPIVIKPRNSQSSRGVFIIENFQDLDSKIQLSLNESIGYDDILIEEFIDGVEYTVEGISIDGSNRTLAYSQKKTLR